ncbi:MAG: peroxiredoxin [Acidobacteriia bacterium]|nr:peroxiredoxin [Terriglobia bacterium]
MTKTVYMLVALVGLTATVMFYYDACSHSEESTMRLKEGDPAPDFQLPSQTGATVRLSDFRNKKNVVLYFYPKDNTPGCTKEACNFRDDISQFASKETEVLGVSLDSVESHQRFARKYDLNFTLLSDRDREVTDTYGVMGGWLGFKFAKRTTFLIDKGGIIRKIFPGVRVSGHDAEVLAAIRGLEEKGS